jgi:hypothetical protein
MDVGAIKGALSFDISEFSRGMMTVNTVASVFPGVVQSFLANPLLGLIDLSKRAANALAGVFTSTAKRVDDLDDLAQSLGVSVRQLSLLGDAASFSGGGVEEVAEAVKFLSRAAAEAAGGNQALAATFARVGFSAADIQAAMSDPVEAMIRLGDGMKGLGSAGERTAMSMELLGRGSRSMVGMLSQGSGEIRRMMAESAALGGGVSESQAKAAAGFSDAMGKMRIAWDGIKRAFMEPMAIALTGELNKVLDWVKQNPAEIKRIAIDTANAIVSAMRFVGEMALWAAKNLEPLLKAFATLKGITTGFAIGSRFGGTVGGVIGGAIGGVLGFGGSSAVMNAVGSAPPKFIKYDITANIEQSDKTVRQMSDEFSRKVQTETEIQEARMKAGLVGQRMEW